jgi:hypothetical protein
VEHPGDYATLNSYQPRDGIAEPLERFFETVANMDQFVRSQNVERYRRLLERVTDEPDRQHIINLLAEERQKQKDAGDPVW